MQNGGVNVLIHWGRDKKLSCHFANDIFTIICLEIAVFWFHFTKIVPKGAINNKPTLIQIMACRQTDDKSLSEPMLASFIDIVTSMRRWASIC